MARKRMFDTEVINQDRFFDLSIGARCIYFLLGLEADDEGFISPRRIIRAAGGTPEMLDELVDSGFLFKFDSGIVAITDWHRNNYLDKTRVKPTIYSNERNLLYLNPETSVYQRLTDVQQMLKQNSIEENSLDQCSIVEHREEENSIDKNSKDKISKEEILCPVLMNEDDTFTKKVIDCLNRILNTNYNWEDKKAKDLIIGWKNKNHSYLDFEIVIKKMFREWHNSKMSIHLNPYTLFGDKFEMYLNAPVKKITLDEISMADIDRMIEAEKKKEQKINVGEQELDIITHNDNNDSTEDDEFDRTIDDIFGISKRN